MITKYSRPYPKLSFHGIQFNSPRVKSKNHFCRSTAGSCATYQTKPTTAGCITAARGPHIYPLTRTICVHKTRALSTSFSKLPKSPTARMPLKSCCFGVILVITYANAGFCTCSPSY